MPTLGEAVKAWCAVSLQTFGGPAGQIAVMQRVFVDERRWITQDGFLVALSFCTLLPGPEAHQLATYLGWRLHGLCGAAIAGSLFVLPGVVTMLALSAVYVVAGETPIIDSLLIGLSSAVVAVVLQALVRVSRRSLARPAALAIAVAAFIAIAVLNVSFPVVIAGAALLGRLAGRRLGHSEGALSADADTPTAAPWRAVTTLLVGVIAWLAPVVVAIVVFGRSSTVVDEAVFFAGSALVTFGGGYAVLTYVAQQAVVHHGWLSAHDMIRGLALAETTPGPLIMVVQFVAFLGAFHHPGDANPWVAAVVAALLTSWVTFVPSLVFVAVGAPFFERLHHVTWLRSSLAGVSAAVVGVIASLAMFFAAHTLFADPPQVRSLQLAPLLISIVALGLVARGWSVVRVLGACAILGLVSGLYG